MMKSLCLKMKKIIVKWPFSCICIHVSMGRERVLQQQAFFVVSQPISFWISRKWAKHSTWFIFPGWTRHFLVRYFLAKCSFQSSFCLLWSFWSRRLTRMGPSASSRKIQKLTQQTFKRRVSDKHACEIVTHGIPWYSVGVYVWWCGCVFCSEQLLRLQSAHCT